MNRELPDVQVGFRKGRGTRDQMANIHWIIEKGKIIPEKHHSASLTMPKPFNMWITTNWRILKEMGILNHLTCLLKSVCKSRSNSSNWMDMEQLTGSNLEKGYFKTSI